MTERDLLLRAVVELEYMHCAENLCQVTSGESQAIVEEGMKLLGMKDLSEEEIQRVRSVAGGEPPKSSYPPIMPVETEEQLKAKRFYEEHPEFWIHPLASSELCGDKDRATIRVHKAMEAWRVAGGEQWISVDPAQLPEVSRDNPVIGWDGTYNCYCLITDRARFGEWSVTKYQALPAPPQREGTKMTWKKIADRSYELNTPTAQAFVFAANRPMCLWAWSVYWSGGHQAWVESSFAKAKRKAEGCAELTVEAQGKEPRKP